MTRPGHASMRLVWSPPKLTDLMLSLFYLALPPPPPSELAVPGISLPPPRTPSGFNVDRAGPSVFGSHPLSHHSVEGVVHTDIRFQPAASGEISVVPFVELPTEPSPGVEQGVVRVRSLAAAPGVQEADMSVFTDIKTNGRSR